LLLATKFNILPGKKHAKYAEYAEYAKYAMVGLTYQGTSLPTPAANPTTPNQYVPRSGRLCKTYIPPINERTR